MASSGQNPWPSPGRSRDRHRAGFMTALGQKLMALDTEWHPQFIAAWRQRQGVGPMLIARRECRGPDKATGLVRLNRGASALSCPLYAFAGPGTTTLLRSVPPTGRLRRTALGTPPTPDHR